MQQMQYHGIASYKLEYQLSTGGEWQTALDTTASTATSYPYTIDGLTGGNSYNLRATVADRAGNTGTGTNTEATKKPEKNPGGIITDINNDYVIDTIPTELDKTLSWKVVVSQQTQKSVIYTTNQNGDKSTYVPEPMTIWYVMGEDAKNYYLVAKGRQNHSSRTIWSQLSGFGIMDNVALASYQGCFTDGALFRGIKVSDWNAVSSFCQTMSDTISRDRPNMPPIVLYDSRPQASWSHYVSTYNSKRGSSTERS